ncbi:MAG: recombination protein RecR [Candidatus Atribacteria bacterium]|nr:recombination protein RecR [Candidatus Atribacteria bacterium]
MAQSYPDPLVRLISALSHLPGIGPKTAQRIAFYLVKTPREEVGELVAALEGIKQKIRFCQVCGFYSEGPLCTICSDQGRDRSVICVVEQPQDVLAVEKSSFRGLYHVLHGVISPLLGAGPEEVALDQLVFRVREGNIKEVILATNPSVDGEATALFIARKLKVFPVRITMIARGLPLGGDLEFADEATLLQAFEGRRELHLD